MKLATFALYLPFLTAITTAAGEANLHGGGGNGEPTFDNLGGSELGQDRHEGVSGEELFVHHPEDRHLTQVMEETNQWRYFFIKNVATGEFLKTGDFDPKTNSSPLKGEIFGVRRTGDTYFLYGVYHELYLNVFSATGHLSTSMGDGSYGVKWELEDTGIFRTFRLRNEDSNKCLDTNGQSSNAEMEYCRTTDDQKWEFQELVMLKNGPYKNWLRAFDGNPGNVDLTGNQQTYERWVLVPSGDSTEAGERFYLQNYYHQSYLRAHPTNGVVAYSSTSNASVWTRTKSSTSSRYWFSTTNDSSQTLKYLKGTSSGDVTVSTSSTDAHWFRYVTGEFNGEPKTPLVYQDNFYN